jgi:hypothetical protein
VSFLSRSLVSAVAGLALVSMAGCAGKSTGTPPPADALAGVDPCALLKPADATSLGLPARGNPPVVPIPGQPGCEYQGDALTVGVYKDPGDTVQSSQQKTAEWAQFNRVDINGRMGATGIGSGSTRARICDAMFNAGQGTIVVTAHETNPGNNNECADALKIAKLVEPNAPK